MVFRGKPSKACQRCRDRRLKCDFSIPRCGPCIRAHAVCTGYRDTQQIRITNETQAVRRKALLRQAYSLEPHSLNPSLELQARDAFFAFHVTKTSRSWDFLEQFRDPTLSPEHLALSIDAVSLAYLSHQVSSNVALLSATEKYVSALRMTNKALQSPELATKDTTLLAALLLDLFEKITNVTHHSNSWTSHVIGALALVKLRGLENFRGPAALQILMRLSNNLIISCCTASCRVPVGLLELRDHVAKNFEPKSLKWDLSTLMISYANLRSDIKSGKFSKDDCLDAYVELDAKFEALSLGVPEEWQYSTIILDQNTDRCFTTYFDCYPGRHVTQAWNVIRMVRILLNEFIVENGRDPPCGFVPDASSPMVARGKIVTLAYEICASVPQYVDCFGIARDILRMKMDLKVDEAQDMGLHQVAHTHTPAENLACYTLIFPLAVAARSEASPKAIKSWIVKELHYMASHFYIRNAEAVAQIIERGTQSNPWDIYTLLGSYAFVA